MAANRGPENAIPEGYELVRQQLQESLQEQRPNSYFRRALKLRLSNEQLVQQARQDHLRRILWFGLGLTMAISLGVGISLSRQKHLKLSLE